MSPGIVKQRPWCRNCGTQLRWALSRCPKCGRRSWANLLAGFKQH